MVCALARLKRPEISVEALALLGALYLASLANLTFWRAALDGRAPGDFATLLYAVGVFSILAALHFAAIGLVATKRTVRPLLALLIVTCTVASHFMQRYGVVLDPSMLRNVLHTELREAAELVNGDLLLALAQGVALSTLLWLVKPAGCPLGQALLVRAGTLAVALALALGALLVTFQDLSSHMRNDRALRYKLVPGNVLWSLARVLASDTRAAAVPREPVEAVLRTVAGPGRKPVLLVIVVGETARAANFSLNGYARFTNPELAGLDLINFPRTTACGTSTEVSLPCMFSPFGRADYDEARIRRHESLPQLLARAGMRVVWLDNQSGCKGVCDGIEFRDLSREQVPGLCAAGRCYDAILLHGLEREAKVATGDMVVVLHQLGNHGPAYYRRYPPEMKRFAPACESNELRDCTRAEIVNAYDNAILYTDRFLASTIRFLARQQDRFEVALVYTSDHGESLGERGLYLHGLPYAIAPREQLEVPMFWWLPAATAQARGLDLTCLRRKAGDQASHDNLYHSVLGVLDVRTGRYRPERDLFDRCRFALTASAR